MIWVTHAIHTSDYCLHVTFSDGTEGDVDLKETIISDSRHLFQELRDIERFRKFRVDMDTVVWDNGLDLAPEYLYDHAQIMAR